MFGSEAILVPLWLFGSIAFVAFIVAWFRFRRYKTLHETLRIMAEKGMPIPPELLHPHEQQLRHKSLRGGLVCLGVGIGLMVWLLFEHHGHWPLSLIPLLMGVALLVSWAIESRNAAKP
jgi:dolichol kinase